MQLLDQQAKATANTAAAEQGVEQENRRAAEHFDDVDAGATEKANFLDKRCFAHQRFPRRSER
ncbi:hypothetical protein [Pseudomonas sp. TE3911]